ncbi:NADP-dependent oxidoreductase [Proteobacteria bacterium 005FR1]|nr:NADP-dependent oxidoreductase [Proteobacteria bacterium 005FR1]
MKSRAIVLAKRPVGEPDDSCFRLEEHELPELKEGEILIQVLWLSLDPYMRGRMNDAKSYVEPTKIGEVMPGESAGVVVASKSDKYKVGDYVTAYTGWQTHFIIHQDAERLRPVNLKNGTLTMHLGVIGMPGRTAYWGLKEVGKPKAGETLVVAAASGAVGSVVGQMAKIFGLRAVGIAGGPEKCRYVKEELGFDECIDYKSGDLDAKLAAACPNGVDVYFENVGGEVAEAVAKLFNPGARAPICGYVSAYNAKDRSEIKSPFDIFAKAKNVPEHRFFVVTEWDSRWQEATNELAEWVKEGKIKFKESQGEGLDNAPELFRGLLKGKNFGKQLVRISEE